MIQWHHGARKALKISRVRSTIIAARICCGGGVALWPGLKWLSATSSASSMSMSIMSWCLIASGWVIKDEAETVSRRFHFHCMETSGHSL